MEKLTFLLEEFGDPPITLSHVLGNERVELRSGDGAPVFMRLKPLAIYVAKLADMEEAHAAAVRGLKGGK